MNANIRETEFAPRTYLVWRKTIAIADIGDHAMWQAAFGKVHDYVQKNQLTAGPGSALYFTWDQNAGRAELGIGNSVEGATEVGDPELSLVPVAGSRAVQATVRGSYEQLREVHGSLQAYVKQRGLNPTLTIEEYTVMGKPDPRDWETDVYYLHE
jgi:effector-binding domain-containing protein